MMFSGVFKGRRVLLTGHTGFKGSWLASWLSDLGAAVCGYSDGVPTEPSHFELAGLAARIDHRIGDIGDLDRLKPLVHEFRPDFVLHLAAQAIVSTSYRQPLQTFATNVMGTATILEALRDVDWPCTAIMVTSDKAYENVEWPWGYRETDRLGGKDVYSASKGAAELVFHAYQQSFFGKPDASVRVASARAGNVIGGGDWAADRIVVDCVKAWTAGRSVEIRSPRATRPWQHVLEPLSGYLTLAAELARSPDRRGESYNFGPNPGQNRTVVELITDLAAQWRAGTGAEPFEVTADIPFNEAGLLKLNCDKALQDLRWQPTLDYDECVSLTGGWYQRVLQDGEDASAVTTEQTRTFERLATERKRVWAVANG